MPGTWGENPRSARTGSGGNHHQIACTYKYKKRVGISRWRGRKEGRKKGREGAGRRRPPGSSLSQHPWRVLCVAA